MSAKIRYWSILVVCVLFSVGAIGFPDDDNFRKKDNGILTTEQDDWFQIDDEDGILTVPQLIKKYGYSVETHSVTTEDGYVLTMFRVLPRQAPATKRLPVLLVHGLLASSADFVITGPNNSLAYTLADDGYDVWLANVRGTRYSKRHESLPIHSEEYWDYSFHEIGYYDLPAMIDYALNKSESAKLLYVGHSQGTTVYFVMSSSRPEYNDKIALMTALSPAVVLKRLFSPMARVMMPLADSIKETMDSLGAYQFLPHNENNRRMLQSLCPRNAKNTVCERLLGELLGPHPEVYSQKLTIAYMGHTPAGASTKQVIHFKQVSQSGMFRQYDYGKKGNLHTYDDWKPPTYNLTASAAPVLIYYGQNDWLVHPRDVREFSTMLPNVVALNLVEDRKFNHGDFIMAGNARALIYDKMRPVFEQYSNDIIEN